MSLHENSFKNIKSREFNNEIIKKVKNNKKDLKNILMENIENIATIEYQRDFEFDINWVISQLKTINSE